MILLQYDKKNAYDRGRGVGGPRGGGDGAGAHTPMVLLVIRREKKKPPSSANSPGLKSQLCHLFRHNIGEINHSETQFLCLKGGGGNNSILTGVNEIRM